MVATSFHNSCLDTRLGKVEVFCESADSCDSGKECGSYDGGRERVSCNTSKDCTSCDNTYSDSYNTHPTSCSVIPSPMPDTLFVDKEGIYLFAASDTHTSSLQSLAFLFHLTSHVGSFPAIRQILLPFPRNAFWNAVLESAQSLLPATARFRVLWREELRQLGDRVCYQSLVTFLGKNHLQTTVRGLRWTADGGAFLRQRDMDSLRAAVYKAQDVAMSGRGFKFVRVLFATTKQVPEMEGIREYYKKNGVRVGERSKR